MKQKQQDIAATIARQLAHHGINVPQEAALDTAAQIVMGHMMTVDDELAEIDADAWRRELNWRPSDSDDGGCWDFTECEVGQ